MKSYKVTGMTCSGCVRALGRALDAAAPGLDYDVELEQAKLTVKSDHDPATIRAAVDDAGFDFEGELEA
jgi:copper chaperone